MTASLLLLGLGAVVVLVGAAALIVLADRRGDARVRAAEAARAGRVREALDLAYQHLELSPALADAVIESGRVVDYASPAHVQRTTERLLAVAREHRGAEPDLALILIDTLRREPG